MAVPKIMGLLSGFGLLTMSLIIFKAFLCASARALLMFSISTSFTALSMSARYFALLLFLFLVLVASLGFFS